MTYSKLRLSHLFSLLPLGFASGLPLALTGQAMQAWLTQENLDLATIGFLSLVALPYTFKFLWAPLMDRFEPQWLGRRRSWIVACQLALAAVLMAMASSNPSTNLQQFAILATLLAFLSASQDVVIDAYRTDLLLPSERGLGSSLAVFGYRLGMIVSGGIAFIWADPASGWNWDWSNVYRLMGYIMLGLAAYSLLALPRIVIPTQMRLSNARTDLVGFAAVLLTVAAGYLLTNHVIEPGLSALGTELSPEGHLKRWMQLLSLLSGLLITVPLATMVTRRIGFETLNAALDQFFLRDKAMGFLIFIVLYKLGDAFAGSITTPFLIKAAAYSQAEVGVVNKVIGIWMTIAGALLGGALMMRLRMYKSLLIFGVLQMLSNFGFYAIAVLGRGFMGEFTLPAFDWGIISLASESQVDGLLLLAVAVENITGGMGTAAAVAFIMSLCDKSFSATQYALLSAFATLGRVWVGPMAGVLAPSTGWPVFFLLSMLLAVPGLMLLIKLKSKINALENNA